MNNNPLTVRDFLLWAVLFAQILFLSAGAFAKIMHWGLWHPVFISGFVFLSISWLFIFIEIFMNNISNRKYWLISMFVLPTISPAFYMIYRKKLLKVLENESVN